MPRLRKESRTEYCGGFITRYSFSWNDVECGVKGGTHRLAVYGDWSAWVEGPDGKRFYATSSNTRAGAIANLIRELERCGS